MTYVVVLLKFSLQDKPSFYMSESFESLTTETDEMYGRSPILLLFWWFMWSLALFCRLLAPVFRSSEFRGGKT